MKRRLIVHHNDADGRCAAAIVANHQRDDWQTECVEADYKDCKDGNWKSRLAVQAVGADELWVVDFSLPPDLMAQVRGLAARTVWIDHHATAKDYPYQDVEGLRDFTDKGPSGAELAWRFIYPDVPAPEIVNLIGDYDAWRLALPYSTALRVALEAMPDVRYPLAPFWRAMLDEKDGAHLTALIAAGQGMISFRDGLAAGLRTRYGFETTFHGLRCCAVNLYGMGSAAIGDDVLRAYDAGLAFIYDGRQWTVSMYSVKPEIDCGAVCKQHGGGGHRGAAGFVCESLPFTRTAPCLSSATS